MRHLLLAGIAAAALLPAPLLAAAPAKHKAVHHRAPAKDARDGEIQQLKEQIQMLAARLDAQEGAQRANADQTASAAAAAASAQQQAVTAQAAADAAVKATPAVVQSQLASYEKKGGWWDSTTVGGRMFFNTSTISAKNGGVKTTGASSLNGTGFNIKRMYINVDHSFSPIFSASLTMDISNVIGQTANTNFQTPTASIPAIPAGGAAATTTNVNNLAVVGRGFYLKQAYLQAKLSPALIIRAGSVSSAWIGYIENQYGYRQIENTYIDRLSFGATADWGVHVLGDLAGGLISYQFSAIDGAGYRNVKVTRTVDLEGRVSAQYKGFYGAVGGYTGKRGNDTQGALLPNGHGLHTATRIDAAVGYKNKLFNVGGEYLHAKNWNNVTTNATDKSEGYSLWGNVNFAPKWSVFGRYDTIKPNKETAPHIKDHYYNTGIQWEPVKIVDLALVYKHDRAIDGAIATSNGTIGAATIGGKYNEFGLWGQLRF